MARYTHEQYEAAVLDAISKAGGRITHSALVEALEARGMGDALIVIRQMKLNGKVSVQLDAVMPGTGNPTLSYTAVK